MTARTSELAELRARSLVRETFNDLGNARDVLCRLADLLDQTMRRERLQREARTSQTWHNPVKSPVPRLGYRNWVAETYDLGVDPAPESREQESYRDRITRLADEQGVRPLVDPAEFKADIWESDAELEEFLADVRRSRNANVG